MSSCFLLCLESTGASKCTCGSSEAEPWWSQPQWWSQVSTGWLQPSALQVTPQPSRVVICRTAVKEKHTVQQVFAWHCENQMLLCTLVSHLHNGTTNSLPAVGIGKMKYLPTHLNTTGNHRKKEICVDTCTIQAAPSSRSWLLGTTAFKTGHAGNDTRRHNERSY